MTKGKRFIQNISASAIQMIINQAMGLVIFYVLSTQLDKATFGNFNWALAILLTSFGVLSCGVDQLVVKKIAVGENVNSVLSLYLLHVLLMAVFFYGLITFSYFFFPSFFSNHLLLIILSVAKLFTFFSTPFKQLCIGLERFRALLFMSIGSNAVKGVLLLLLFAIDQLSIKLILAIFVAGDLFELIVSVFISSKYWQGPLQVSFNFYKYKQLLKEAFPQLGTVILSVVMARMDWILIGLFLAVTKLAEYSFAYKAFEVCTFPLLIIAPLLIPLFSKVFGDDLPDIEKLMKLKLLLSVELAIASFTSLVLVIVWVPIIDFITAGKYGNVNRNTIFILSLSIPFLYFNNFMWTINFSRSKLKLIFSIFVITFLVNLAADLLLIPRLQNEGAAAACFLALLAQSLCFLRVTKIIGLEKLVYPLFICPICALASGFISTYCFKDVSIVLISSVCIYLTSVIISLRIAVPQIRIFRSVLVS